MTSSYRTYTDSELIDELYSSVDTREQAFRELYRRHARAVFVYAQRILSNRILAEEVLQDCFVDFLKYVLQHRDIDSAAALLLRIARNRCLNIKRKSPPEMMSIDDINLVSLGVENDEAYNDDFILVLQQALDLLSEEQREAVVLQMYNGLSYQEIAELCEVPLSTVRNRIVRAKNKLREILEPYREQNRQ